MTEEQEEKAVALSKQFKETFGKDQFKEIKKMTMVSPIDFHGMIHSGRRNAHGFIEAGGGLGIFPLNDEWAWTGGKPGGVEGGFTARRIPPKDLTTLFTTNQEARELLEKWSAEGNARLPEALRGKAGEELQAALLGLSEGGRGRWFLGTEVIGAGDATAKFENFGERTLVQAEQELGANMDRSIAGLAYGTTFLLGDFDSNSAANMGLLKKGDALYPVQFDLGHPNPGKYELDKRTWLPMRNRDHSGMGSLYFLIGGSIKGLEVGQHKAGFQAVVSKREAIEAGLNLLGAQMSKCGASNEDKQVVLQLQEKIIAHLEKIRQMVID